MTENAFASAGRALAFGGFRLLLTQRILLEGNRQVRLGSRALQILFTLLEHAGEVVPKGQLLARVWPGVFVEEGTLRVHIASLRRVLGDNHSGLRFIENVTGHGYRFVAPVSVIDDSTAAGDTAEPIETFFPVELTRMIGRAHIADRLFAQVPERRLVTIVGAGGIGKTTLALATAERLRESFNDGVHLVNLAGISDPGRVASAVASVLRRPVFSDNPLPYLAEYMHSKHLLVVLDNCEHVIDAAAMGAEYLLKSCAQLHILATSREPLRATGEWIQRLGPLPLPDNDRLTAVDALRFPAIQLFVERAAADTGNFTLTDDAVSEVVAICRKLDGLPLAIELAAASVTRFGLRGLAARLDDRLQVLKSGRRTALARHKTLRATLDWSYDLLPPVEQQLLRKVSVFAGSFDAQAAARVAENESFAATEVADSLADLTTKSLLVADFAGDDVLYRLLNTTRAYALEKLGQSDQEAAAARLRHAQLCHEWVWPMADESRYSPAARIDDMRGALDWCFSANGDLDLGMQLLLSSAGLWFRLEFLDEYGHRVFRALQVLEAIEGHERVEMELSLLLGEIILYMRGLDPLVVPALNRAHELASRLHDGGAARECLWVMFCERVRAGDYSAAFSYAEQRRNTPDDANKVPGLEPLAEAADSPGDWMFSLAHHFRGNHAEARTFADSVLARDIGPTQRQRYPILKYDNHASTYAVLARILWIQGFPEQAVAAGRRAIERAQGLNHVLSTCYALISAAVVHMWVGNLNEARRLAGQLDELATRHSLDYWLQWARCIEWGAASSTPRNIDIAATVSSPFHCPAHLETLATFDGSFASELVFVRVEKGLADWCAPEVLRAKAITLQRSGNPPARVIEAPLQAALGMARRQGARSWELRIASSLAQLWADSGRAAAARELLRGVVARFGEGYRTADLVAAQTLLKGLSHLQSVSRRA